MLTKAYGESAMSKTRVYEWYKRFQDGREDVEDDECPSTSTQHSNLDFIVFIERRRAFFRFWRYKTEQSKKAHWFE